MVQQTSLFPIDLVLEEPYLGDTKTLAHVGWDLSKNKFAIKSERDGALLPLTEWISYHLCRYCSIPTPNFEIVRRIDGSLSFGVRWEDNAIQIGPHFSSSANANLLRVHHKEVSAILTLDQFLPNIDRHAGNFLFVSREGTQICLSFDYSQAGARVFDEPRATHPLGIWPMPVKTTTNKLIANLPGGKIDTKVAAQVNISLSNITRQNFESILLAAPDEWFTITDRPSLMHWWDNESAMRIPK